MDRTCDQVDVHASIHNAKGGCAKKVKSVSLAHKRNKKKLVTCHFVDNNLVSKLRNHQRPSMLINDDKDKNSKGKNTGFRNGQ